ncbi:hypothetical protein [Silanimonas sp.]|uniref:hypothetical protein n=1 Tax=Silanimonas sp. TaxID=1929290 RepID=UPI00260D4CF8|nr:hypothetical protein [Silanimonas sp.]
MREAAALVAAGASQERIVVLGELHGTHEAPALAGELVGLRWRQAHGAPGEGVTLALEIHATEQSRIDAFLDSSGDAAARDALISGPYWAVEPERSDGRRSVAMLTLLKSVRERRSAGEDLRVLAFDPGSGGGDANVRNPRMAAVLREAFARDPERRFVVLVGNYHARRAPPTRVGGLLPGQSPPVPTMAHLADVPMFVVNVMAARGEHWACRDGSCQPWPLEDRGAIPGPRFHRSPRDPAGRDAQLVLPEYSAARPVDVGRQR